jgi:hypothetical protein
MGSSKQVVARQGLLGERDARFENHIFGFVDRQYPAVAAPPFQSIKLPRGVVLSFVRADGSVVKTANVE